LRSEVLKRLNVKKLEDFKEKGYFLIDTIKCRICKPIKKKSLYTIAKTCSKKFLKKEIRQMKPKIIFILGNTAKYALGELPEFKELKKVKITSGYKAELSGYQVILCPYPGGQTRKYENQISRAFREMM
jgi:uracil-DNA glycosylase